MGGVENGEMGFQYRGEKVGEETISSMPMFKSSNGGGGDTIFGSGWEQLISLNNHHGENYGGNSSMVMPHSEFANPNYPIGIGMVNQGLISSSTSHLGHYPSTDSGLGELIPKLSGFGNGNFSEMVGAFGVREDGAFGVREDAGSSPNGKRKLGAVDSRSPINPNMNSEGDQQMDRSEEGDELSKDQNEKKQKIEKNTGTNLRGKNTGKQTKDTSQSGEAPKEDYIHVRARRGQATNSHSLAERVRREKISERMKMLQELVPGCNKITGKSVMLDEIINYVQSLQQQVEFLSMKLATVNPELNIDLDRILSKDILHSRDANSAILGISSGTNTSHPYANVGIHQGNLRGVPSTAPQFHPMPQTVWDTEIQSLIQMGYESNPGFDNQGLKDAQNQRYRTLEEMKRSVPF